MLMRFSLPRSLLNRPSVCVTDRNKWMQHQTDRKGRTNPPLLVHAERRHAETLRLMCCWGGKKHYQSYSLPLKFNKYNVKGWWRKKMNIKRKNMKLQPYIDFWASEIETDFSCPACVLFWCLCPSVSLPTLSVSAAKATKPGSDPFVPSFLFPSSLFPFSPSPSPYAMFSIFWNVNVLLVDTVHEW